MVNTKKTFLLFYTLFFCLFSFAQPGSFFLKHFTHTCDEADNFNFLIREDREGIMLFANSKGILCFDGIHWQLLSTDQTPLTLEPDNKTGRVYAGFRNDFGFFEKNNQGIYHYQSLRTKKINPEEINKIVLADSTVYFCNEASIFQYSLKDKKVKPLFREKSECFFGFAVYKRQLIVNRYPGGLHLLKGEKLMRLKNGDVLEGTHLLFGIESTPERTILGNSADELYTVENGTVKKFTTEADHYLKENLLSDGINLNETEIILGTLGGGCFIINAINGHLTHHISAHSGLPDNEVMALGKDWHGGIWISHSYGFTRVSYDLPIKEFSSYKGLEGKLLSVIVHGEILYVSTTEGIYYLTQEEKVFTKPATETEITQRKHVSCLLDHVFFKKRLSKEIDHTTGKKKSDQNTAVPHLNAWHFKQVKGVYSKCKFLVPYGNKLIAASNTGLYEIMGGNSIPILKETYIHCIVPSLDNKVLYAGTKSGILKIEFSNNRWLHQVMMEDGNSIYSINETSSNTLWAAGSGKLIRIDISYRKPAVKNFPLNEVHENTVIRSFNGVTTFFISNTVYFYSSVKDAVLPDPGWKDKNISFLFAANQPELTWVKRDGSWEVYHCTLKQGNQGCPNLSFFKSLKDIYYQKNGTTWIIDNNNRLFKAEAGKQIYQGPLKLHFREIKNIAGTSLPLKNIELNHSDNSLHFIVSAPFYLHEKSVQFQYYLEGMNSEWSGWAKDNKIELTYLPVGEYTLHVRAKNELGQLSEVHKVYFRIRTPYWKTAWFFGLQFLFFGGLIFLSMFLNRNNEGSMHTKVLTFLTLILIVEFIVYEVESVFSLGNSESPLIRFGFNVLLALMISPIEKIVELILSKRKRRIAKILLVWRKRKFLRGAE